MTAYRCRHKDDDEWSKQIYYYEKPSDARYSFYGNMRECYGYDSSIKYIDIRSQKYDDTEEIGNQVIDPLRLKVANSVLQKLDPHCEFFVRNDRVMIRFPKGDERCWYPLERLWPAWSEHRWGGTWTNALAMLVRWVVGLPVYGLNYWRRDFSNRIINLLRRGNYPERTTCVLCGEFSGGDWWTDDYRNGPCCSMGRCVDKETA